MPGENFQTEEARHIRQAQQLVTMVQQPRDAQFGKGRSMHRRELLGFDAEFEVLTLANGKGAGLFGAPHKYRAKVRLSNGSPTPNRNDIMADIRGFAIKVLNDADDGIQDFVLINQEWQFVPTSDEFVDAVLALVQYGQRIGPVVYALERPTKALRRIQYVKTLNHFLEKRFTGFTTESFFSATPIKYGETAVRIALRPPVETLTPGTTPLNLQQDITAKLTNTDLVYAFEIQRFEREETTPIEDASINWLTDFEKVATLTIRQGKSPLPLQELERTTFDPWQCLDAHRPLGEMMRSRRHAYKASRNARLRG